MKKPILRAFFYVYTQSVRSKKKTQENHFLLNFTFLSFFFRFCFVFSFFISNFALSNHNNN